MRSMATLLKYKLRWKEWKLMKEIKLKTRRIMISSLVLLVLAYLKSIKSKLKNKRKNLLKRIPLWSLCKKIMKCFLNSQSKIQRCLNQRNRKLKDSREVSTNCKKKTYKSRTSKGDKLCKDRRHLQLINFSSQLLLKKEPQL